MYIEVTWREGLFDKHSEIWDMSQTGYQAAVDWYNSLPEDAPERQSKLIDEDSLAAINGKAKAGVTNSTQNVTKKHLTNQKSRSIVSAINRQCFDGDTALTLVQAQRTGGWCKPVLQTAMLSLPSRRAENTERALIDWHV